MNDNSNLKIKVHTLYVLQRTCDAHIDSRYIKCLKYTVSMFLSVNIQITVFLNWSYIYDLTLYKIPQSVEETEHFGGTHVEKTAYSSIV